MLDDPLPKLHRMAHQLNPTVVSTTLNPLARLASLPFAPVEGSAKTLAHFSLHPGSEASLLQIIMIANFELLVTHLIYWTTFQLHLRVCLQTGHVYYEVPL